MKKPDCQNDCSKQAIMLCFGEWYCGDCVMKVINKNNERAKELMK